MRANVELQERELQERRLRQQVKEREQSNVHMEQKFTSLEEEVQMKTAKLKKLFGRYQQAKQDIKESRIRNQREREELWEMRRTLEREIKLKQLIIEKFVPKAETNSYDPSAKPPRVIWNEDGDVWEMTSSDVPPDSLLPTRLKTYAEEKRPLTDFARSKSERDKSSRYRSENLVDLPLYKPDRTTQDFEQDMTSRIKEALDLALEREDDEDVVASPTSSLLARMDSELSTDDHEDY